MILISRQLFCSFLLIIFFPLFCIFSSALHASEIVYDTASTNQTSFHPGNNSTFHAGVVFPGATIGIQTNRFGFELKGIVGDDFFFLGPRLTYSFWNYSHGNFYLSFEYLTGDFQGVITEGTGRMGGSALGIRQFMSDRLSVNLDLGPYLMELEDDLSKQMTNELHFILNAGIYLHF